MQATRVEAAVTSELEELHLEHGESAAAAAGICGQHFSAPPTSKATLDLPALVAPLLLQRSPAARLLYWKLLLLPLPALQAAHGAGQAELQRLQQLHRWVSLQLHCGQLVKLGACDSAYVEGPVSLHGPGNGSTSNADGSVMAELSVCTATLSSACDGSIDSTALAGTSALVIAVPGGSLASPNLHQWAPFFHSMTEVIPVLLVAGTNSAAQQWQEAITSGHLQSARPVHVISVQAPARAAKGSVQQQRQDYIAPIAYSKQQLAQGLRWLAAHAPPQPLLKVRGLIAGSAARTLLYPWWCALWLVSCTLGLHQWQVCVCRYCLWKCWQATRFQRLPFRFSAPQQQQQAVRWQPSFCAMRCSKR